MWLCPWPNGSAMEAMSNRYASVRKSDLTGGINCPLCDTKGTVDFIDLVRGVSSLHCDPCGSDWKMKTPASMGHLAG